MTDHSHDVGCIVLAAGGSSRFGRAKQLEGISGETLVHRAVRAAFECGAKFVILVTGAHEDEVRFEVSEFDSLIIASNTVWSSGIASSLRAGLEAAEAHRPFDGLMITLADQPLVDARSLENLIKSFDREHRIIAASYSETFGAPALIGAEHVTALMCLDGDTGAGPWLRAQRDAVTLVDIPEAGFDIDTAGDLSSFSGPVELE